jgi:hypothetical protein
VKIDQNDFKKLAKVYHEALQKKIKHNMKISGKQEEKENLQQLNKSMQTGQDVKVSVINFFDQSLPLGPLLGSVLRRVLSVVLLTLCKTLLSSS